MAVGSAESFMFHLVILGLGVIVWAILLRLLKIKSLALAFALAYLTLVGFAVFKGWRPLEPGAFMKSASEAVTLSWPATLLVKFVKSKFYYVILLAGMLQYCIVGWVLDMIAGSIFGDEKK